MFLLNLYQIYLIKVKNGFVGKAKKSPFLKLKRAIYKVYILKSLFRKSKNSRITFNLSQQVLLHHY